MKVKSNYVGNMKRLVTLLLILFCKTAMSQDVVDHYYNFGGAITEGKESSALMLAEKILPESSLLSAKQQAIFFYKLAGLFENLKNTEQAINYYKRSLEIEPNYYVPHMALGYLYLSQANLLANQINDEKKDAVLQKKYVGAYNNKLKQALPHLEKAMACDPNDQVLSSINFAYKAFNDTVSLHSLNSRLRELEKGCVTLLTE